MSRFPQSPQSFLSCLTQLRTESGRRLTDRRALGSRSVRPTVDRLRGCARFPQLAPQSVLPRRGNGTEELRKPDARRAP